LCLIVLGTSAGHAQVRCNFESTAFNVGRYNPLDTAGLSQRFPVRVRCTAEGAVLPPGGVVAVTLRLEPSAGGAGAGLRRMTAADSGSFLNYVLLLPPTYSFPWGAGPGETLSLSVTGLNAVNASQIAEQDVELRVPARQMQAAVGNYADTLNVTYTF
jgi:spore coat protein U-like protein